MAAEPAVAAPVSATVTTPVTGPPIAPVTAPVSPSGQLVRYLDRIEPHQTELDRLRQQVLAAVEKVHPARPDRTWAVAATKLSSATAGLDRLSVAVLGVKPPPRLSAAHQDLAESIAVLESYVYDVKNALNARIPSLLATAANADFTVSLTTFELM